MFAHDPDDREIVRRAVARRHCVADMLPERVALREKLLRHHLIDDHHPRRILVFRFRCR